MQNGLDFEMIFVLLVFILLKFALHDSKPSRNFFLALFALRDLSERLIIPCPELVNRCVLVWKLQSRQVVAFLLGLIQHSIGLVEVAVEQFDLLPEKRVVFFHTGQKPMNLLDHFFDNGFFFV